MSGKDPASTPGGQSNEFLQRAYALDGVDAARDLYNEWAKEYDNDLEGLDYMSPQAAVDVLKQHRPETKTEGNGKLEILDAGCGTGLVGVCLKEAHQDLEFEFEVDGVDLTPGMLEVAGKKGIYRDLLPADLNEKIDKAEDGTYDVVFCVGTLTKGHVGPNCLGEFARVARKGGLIVATIHDEVWEGKGYMAEVEGLRGKGEIDVLSTAEFGMVKSASDGARMVVLRRK